MNGIHTHWGILDLTIKRTWQSIMEHYILVQNKFQGLEEEVTYVRSSIAIKHFLVILG